MKLVEPEIPCVDRGRWSQGDCSFRHASMNRTVSRTPLIKRKRPARPRWTAREVGRKLPRRASDIGVHRSMSISVEWFSPITGLFPLMREATRRG